MGRGGARADAYRNDGTEDQRPTAVGKKKSDLKLSPGLFGEGDPLCLEPEASPQAAFSTAFLAFVALGLTVGGILTDEFYVAQSGATAGLSEMRDENGKVLQLQGSWEQGGKILTGCVYLSLGLSGLAMLVECVNVCSYTWCASKIGMCSAWFGCSFLCLGGLSYWYLSKGELNDPAYDNQEGRYVIQRDWKFGWSFIGIMAAGFLSILMGVGAFFATPEAQTCSDTPCVALKYCLTCSHKPHKVAPVLIPLPPSLGGTSLNK